MGEPRTKRRATKGAYGRREYNIDAMSLSERQSGARSSRPDLDDLQALLALGDAHHHLLAGRQRFHAMAAQHRGVHEDVAVGGLARHQTVTAFVVVPLDQRVRVIAPRGAA